MSIIYVGDVNRALTCTEFDENFKWCEDEITTNAENITTNAENITSNLNEISRLNRRNFVAITDPTATDDETKGYVANLSVWINTDTDKLYKCTDATTDTAVWIEMEIQGELEKVDEGWRYRGADPTKFTEVGYGSLDFTMWDSADDEIGTEGEHSFSMGLDNTNLGVFNYVNGVSNTVDAYSSIVLGRENTVDAYSSIVLGRENAVGAEYSIVVGRENTVDAYYSIVWGIENTVKNSFLFFTMGENGVFGDEDNETSHYFSIGDGNVVAEGDNNTFLHGNGLKSNGLNSTWFGNWNVNTAEIVFGIGNGADDENRSNFLELRDNGVIYIDKMVGTTDERPTLVRASSFPYLDTDLGKPIWYNGTDWIDAMGTVV